MKEFIGNDCMLPFRPLIYNKKIKSQLKTNIHSFYAWYITFSNINNYSSNASKNLQCIMRILEYDIIDDKAQREILEFVNKLVSELFLSSIPVCKIPKKIESILNYLYRKNHKFALIASITKIEMAIDSEYCDLYEDIKEFLDQILKKIESMSQIQSKNILFIFKNDYKNFIYNFNYFKQFILNMLNV